MFNSSTYNKIWILHVFICSFYSYIYYTFLMFCMFCTYVSVFVLIYNKVYHYVGWYNYFHGLNSLMSNFRVKVKWSIYKMYIYYQNYSLMSDVFVYILQHEWPISKQTSFIKLCLKLNCRGDVPFLMTKILLYISKLSFFNYGWRIQKM